MTDSGHNPLRQALWPLGVLYGAVSAARNLTFDAGWRRIHKLPVPVVSIGNLTVGGTGKTPTAAWLCRLAMAHGKKPGVLARGYGREPGARLNDEGEMLSRRLPDLLQEQDPDRVAGGGRLIAGGADYIVLDDGFQHRRLHRDLDVVCLDARLPFGNNQCLPSGDLREFRSGLRRAGLVLLTRADRITAEQRTDRVQGIRRIAGRDGLAIHSAVHEPSELISYPAGDSQSPVVLQGKKVVLLSAIARPASFCDTIVGLGGEVCSELRYRDHHRFTSAEAEAAAAAAKREDAWLVTTEKDDAKLSAFAIERHVLRIDLRFVDGEPKPSEFLL